MIYSVLCLQIHFVCFHCEPTSILANILDWIPEIIWQGVWGQPTVPSESKVRSFWEVQSPLPKMILRFLSVQKVRVFFNRIYNNMTYVGVTVFLQKKIYIKLKYLLEKFGNSGESNSCPGSLLKGQNYWGSGRNLGHWHVCNITW
jgi:hypothetical protein